MHRTKGNSPTFQVRGMIAISVRKPEDLRMGNARCKIGFDFFRPIRLSERCSEI